MTVVPGESPTAVTKKGRVRPSRCVRKAPRECQFVVHPPFISRQFSPVFWSGFLTEIQSVFFIGPKSAEGYPLPVNDIPQAREIPKNTPYHDVFMGAMPSSRRGNTSPLSVGQETHPRNSFPCKQQQGRYKNYSCNP
ncbi:hypothetical protein TNCV_956411 [Trichonephila clavipes]|nr:hypothetical protein TNCV_956411 [Trichonephila clavipes]